MVMMLNAFSNAQETPVQIFTTANLGTILSLNIEPETFCEFGIQKVNQGLYQITRQPEDVMFTVEATGNWNLSISSDQSYFRGVNDSTKRIPLDFVGFYIESRGTNWDDGLFSNIANATKDTTLFLSPDRKMILENGMRNNLGNAERNSFVLRWKFFYENDEMRTKKFSDFDILDDNYTVDFSITLSESPPKGRNNE